VKRVDPDDVKVVPLKADVPVVRSPKVPAAPKAPAREWRDFDDFARLADELDRIGALTFSDKPAVWHAESALAEWRGVERTFQRFAKAREFYERDDLYEVTKQSRRNLVGTWTEHQLTRRVVTEQVGMLIGSFPNATPIRRRSTRAC
jgi:hypothetical protein